MSNEQLIVDLYVRADASVTDQRTALIERFTCLERRGKIAEFTVHLWPRTVSLTLARAVEDRRICEPVRSFEQWADRHGVRLRPPFDVRTVQSDMTGERDQLLVLPVCCLAVRNERRLVGVAPCHDGGSACSLDDVLDAIEQGRLPRLWPETEDAAVRTAVPDEDVSDIVNSLTSG